MMLSDVCVSDVSLSRTLGLSREHRSTKTKLGTEVAHVTRDSDTDTDNLTRTTKRQNTYRRKLTQQNKWP